MKIWQTQPFPHAVFYNLFDRKLLERVAAEFPAHDAPAWRRYGNAHEYKLEGGPKLWGAATLEYFEQLASHADWLGEMAGIANLSMETIGGGYHMIPPGGYLKVHTDFNRSPDTKLYRRLNVLTYLNDADPGGHLELWDDDGLAVMVPPLMGTTVAFETSDRSWHGHPRPATAWRRSVAAYFFSPDPPVGYSEDHSTRWHRAS